MMKTGRKKYLEHDGNNTFKKPSTKTSDLSDLELIKHCLKSDNKKQVWETFFKRFNTFIDRRICKTLHTSGIAIDADVVGDIRLGIVEKLYKEKILIKAEDIINFKAWLGKVVRNHTLDWIRARQQLGRSYQEMVEKETVSLSDPVSGHENFFIEDTISDQSHDQAGLSNELEDVFEEIEKLGGKYRLALKIAIMFYDPLSDATIQKIAQIKGLPIEKIKEDVEKISKDLIRRHSKALRDHNRAFILWAFIKRLNARLYVLEQDPVRNHSKIIKALKKEIAAKIQRMNTLRSRHQRLIRPSSKQIAGLIGIPEEKSTTINILLFRAREMLKKKETLVTG